MHPQHMLNLDYNMESLQQIIEPIRKTCEEKIANGLC